jgi:glycosyl transferase, family 25
VKAYVINLARSRDRRAHITAELKKTGLDYEILTAVDGLDVDLTDRTIVDPAMTYMTIFLAGATGAALSHLSAYKKMIEDGLDKALVLEDDVTLPADLASLADAVADQLTGAEVALLSYGSGAGSCKLSREGSVELPSERLLALPIEIRVVVSGGAYIITREACERLIKFIMPVRVNADDWWYFYREGALDRVRCVVPMPVHKESKLISTLGSYKLGHSSLKGRLVWALVQFKIPILHQVLNRRRQRIQDRWTHQELVDIPFIEKPSRLD